MELVSNMLDMGMDGLTCWTSDLHIHVSNASLGTVH
jgi:hypothetical protein